ncbi:MAG: AmmeMemoRadiSam system protein A [Chloroflexi bacterium]|nr:AmmeMemoRadiSam system protein A [Chloroflexota bacterium]
MLSDSDRSALLSIAREAITAAANRRRPPPLDLDSLSPPLRDMRATFVTLTVDHDLRGCIGGLEPRLPLALDAQEHAVSAAMDDPRFPPVMPAEVPELRIEISVLTVPEPVPHNTPEELLAALRPGIDGVILKSIWRHKATFLPQVWEKVPDPIVFLEMLSEKMGASPDAWRSQNTEVYRYQVEMFEEPAGKGQPTHE